MARLKRASIRFRHPVNGLMFADGHEADGIAVVRFAVHDEMATTLAAGRWHGVPLHSLGEEDLREAMRAKREPVMRPGFVLVHALSGRWLTPNGWNLPDMDAAAKCLRQLVDRAPEGVWHQPVPVIARFGGLAAAAHREAGAFTGKFDFLRRIDAAIDEATYAERLASLRAGPACDTWKARGPAPRKDAA